MTKHTLAIGRRHLALFRGFKRRIKVRPFQPARTGGSRSAKTIESLTRSGKTQDHSERTIGNTCLAMNVRNPISIRAPASMSHLLCEIISYCKKQMSPTGGLWTSTRCHVGHGPVWEKTITLLSTVAEKM